MMSYASGPLNIQMRALNLVYVKAGEKRLAVKLNLVLSILIMMNVVLDVTSNVTTMYVSLLWGRDATVMLEWLYSMANANQGKDVSLVRARTRKYGMQEKNGQETIVLCAPAQILDQHHVLPEHVKRKLVKLVLFSRLSTGILTHAVLYKNVFWLQHNAQNSLNPLVVNFKLSKLCLDLIIVPDMSVSAHQHVQQ